MTAAVQIIKRALNMIGAHSEVMPADPELISIGREQLATMLGELVEDEIYVGATLSSLTSSGLTATATKAAHGFVVGDVVQISGADQGAYNGEVTILTLPTVDTFTFSIPQSATSPATGTVRAMVFPGEPGSQVGEARGATTDLEFLLARRLAPICRLPFPADVAMKAADSDAALRRRYQVPSVPNIVPSTLLPRGQGAPRGYGGPTFFNGQALNDDTSTPT